MPGKIRAKVEGASILHDVRKWPCRFLDFAGQHPSVSCLTKR
ncbi:hypothetical protein QO017_005051 [Methylobacterium gregans]|nr:hypothetical protein [Methylobacterium gregans]